MSSLELSPIEQELYDFIKRSGVVITTQIPRRKAGAIPNLVKKGLVEVFKRSLSPWKPKKAKFVRAIDRKNNR